MNKITFDALPIVNNIRMCPSADYAAIEKFAEWCCFAEGCSFGVRCSFGEGCSFGERCSFGVRCSCWMPTASVAIRFGEGCSFGVRCCFAEGCSFGEWCSFGKGCSFGVRCCFAEGCSFGEWCRFEGRKALPGHPFIAIDGAGTRNSKTYFFNLEGGICVRCGCFSGTVEEFKQQVIQTHGNNIHAQIYLRFAEIAELKFTKPNRRSSYA